MLVGEVKPEPADTLRRAAGQRVLDRGLAVVGGQFIGHIVQVNPGPACGHRCSMRAGGGLDYLRLVDLNTVEAVDTPTRRNQLWPLGPIDAILAGGTWNPIALSDNGIELAATCTPGEGIPAVDRPAREPPDLGERPLMHQCTTAPVSSFTIWEHSWWREITGRA